MKDLLKDATIAADGVLGFDEVTVGKCQSSHAVE